jgi:hypothetical protein
MKYHDEEYFGLGRDDQVALLKKRRKDWTAPNLTQRRANAQHVAGLKRREKAILTQTQKVISGREGSAWGTYRDDHTNIQTHRHTNARHVAGL